MRLAIIGYGGMGSWHHQSIEKNVPEIQVVGAYDIQQEARDKAVKAGIKAYDSLKSVLEDASIDIVTIATPNDFHKDLAIQALRAGKAVVCEKPVCLNAGELEEVMKVAKETGKLFSIHQNRRWDKDFCMVKSVIDSGVIGKPYFIESRVQGSRGAMHGWRGHKLNGGGMLLDWGVHLIDQVMHMIDSKVIAVEGHLVSVKTPEVEDNLQVILRFENGVSTLIGMATNCFINLPRWHVSCDNGTMQIDDWSCGGKIVQLNTDAPLEWANDIVYTEAGPTRTMAPRPPETTREIPLPEISTDWSEYYKNIVAVLNGKAELIVKPEQALRVMKVIDLLFESEEKKHGLACSI